ncbi:MAG: hypothetical protein AAGE43_13500 [Pseudomonadota bacterium]
MKALTLITAAALASFSMTAAAKAPSTLSEERGYQACLKANSSDVDRLLVKKDYLYRTTETGRTFYINASIWENGERVPVAFTCNTTRSGRLIENMGISYTQFVPATGADPVVAQN